MDNDTITKSTVFQLNGSVDDVSLQTDGETGMKSYCIAISSDNAANDENVGSNAPLTWVLCGSVVLIALIGVYIWKRHKGNAKNETVSGKERALQYELFRQSVIYKKLTDKGYYSQDRKQSLDKLDEHEITELCETISNIFTDFSEFVNQKNVPEKDAELCYLVKSRLTTFELSEIYCVSESAIFKRKQKIKQMFDFSSDKRTLDAIFDEM